VPFFVFLLLTNRKLRYIINKTKIEARLLSVAAYMRGNAYAVKGNAAEVQDAFPEALVLGHGRTYPVLSLFCGELSSYTKFSIT
jgi:hypothetical protein